MASPGGGRISFLVLLAATVVVGDVAACSCATPRRPRSWRHRRRRLRLPRGGGQPLPAAGLLSGLAEQVVFVLVPPLALIFLVLGTIFIGLATPTEGGAMGAAGALMLAAVQAAG